MKPSSDHFLWQKYRNHQVKFLAVILAIASVIMLYTGWLRWGDAQHDFGVQLYIPWRLTEGDVLFRDISVLFGPFSYYFNAIVFEFFGASTHVLFTTNAILAFLTIVILFGVLRRTGGNLAAFVGALYFIVVCVFGRTTGVGLFCFISPYSHELTHGFILSCLGLLAIWRFRSRGQLLFCILGGLCIGATWLTKPEPAIAGTGAAIVLFLLGRHKDNSRPLWQESSIWIASLLAPTAVFTLAFMKHFTFAESLAYALNAEIHAWKARKVSVLYDQIVMGVDDLSLRLTNLATATLVWIAISTAIVAIAWISNRLSWPKIPVAIAVFIAAAATLSCFHTSLVESPVLTPLLFVTIASIFMAAWIYFKYRRHPQIRLAWAWRLTLVLFAGLWLIRMVFNIKADHYGFVLSAPAALLAIVLAIHWLPRKINQIFPGTRLLITAGTLGISLGFIGICFERSLFHLSQADIPVGTGHDLFYSDNRGIPFQEVIKAIQRNTPLEATVLTAPEGTMINFLTRRRNPSNYLTLLPTIMDWFGNQKVTDNIIESRPDIVVLVHKDTFLWGKSAFGKDYAHDLSLWLIQNYQFKALTGAMPFRNPKEFGILVLARKTSSTSELKPTEKGN